MSRQEKTLRIALYLAVVLNIVFWLSVREFQSRWTNVPPPPPQKYAAAGALGDTTLAYRMNGIMIQNFGDTGGMYTAIKDYNSENLAKWFFVQDGLDWRSDHIPYLAAYYFSASQDPQKIRPILDYLEVIGQRPYAEKWRWMTQAVFLARFRMADMDRALDLAHKLAAIQNDKMPNWTRQMPAFVMTAKGEKQAAYDLLLEILKTSHTKLHPEEVNAMQAYICSAILTHEEAEKNPICTINE
jgi:hypothetical protein